MIKLKFRDGSATSFKDEDALKEYLRSAYPDAYYEVGEDGKGHLWPNSAVAGVAPVPDPEGKLAIAEIEEKY